MNAVSIPLDSTMYAFANKYVHAVYSTIKITLQAEIQDIHLQLTTLNFHPTPAYEIHPY